MSTTASELAKKRTLRELCAAGGCRAADWVPNCAETGPARLGYRLAAQDSEPHSPQLRTPGSRLKLRATGLLLSGVSASAGRARLGSLPEACQAQVRLSESFQRRLACESALSASEQLGRRHRTARSVGGKPCSATVEFLLRSRKLRSPAAPDSFSRLPQVEPYSQPAGKPNQRAEYFRVLRQRIRLLEAQADRHDQSRAKLRDQDLLLAACQASDSSSRPSVRLHANLKDRHQADPLRDTRRAGSGSFRTQLCRESSGQKQQKLGGDTQALSESQQRFTEIHQQITKLKRRRAHGPAGSTLSELQPSGHGSQARVCLPQLAHLQQSSSDSANKTPEPVCTPAHKHLDTPALRNGLPGRPIGASSGTPTLRGALAGSTSQARQRSASGNTGLTEAEHSDSLAGSLVTCSPLDTKRDLSETRSKRGSSLALQQGQLAEDRQTQRPQLFDEARTSPLRKPSLQKLDTATTWNGFISRHQPETERVFKHRRAKKLNLLMNIDPNRLRGSTGCPEPERDPQAPASTFQEGSARRPSGVQSTELRASDRPDSRDCSWSNVFPDNLPDPPLPGSIRTQPDAPVLRPVPGRAALLFAPQQTDLRRSLQPKQAALSPSCGLSPNLSASQRPDEKSTEIESDAPVNLQQPSCSPRPAWLEPGTHNPKLAVAGRPSESLGRGAQAKQALEKKPALRQSGRGTDCGSPASNGEAGEIATEIDHKSLYESFSLMYRTIFSSLKPTTTASRLPRNPLPRHRPVEDSEVLSDVSRSESSPEAESSKDSSSSRSGSSNQAQGPDLRSDTRRALPCAKPQIVVQQPSRKPTPALALPIQDMQSRERFVQQIEVDLCASSSESSSVRRHRRSSSRSSFSGQPGFYGRHKAH